MTDDCTNSTASVADAAEKHGEPGSKPALLVEKDRRHKTIKNLLASANYTVDDKLATVKTAHHVDKDRFQSAFRSLMGK